MFYPQLIRLFLLLSVTIVNGYRIVIFVPTISNSQTLFNYRIGELLAEAGHEVTMFRPMYNPDVTKGKSIKTKELRCRGTDPEIFREVHHVMQGPLFTSDSITPVSWKYMNMFIDQFMTACERIITNEKVMNELKNHDLAIVHMYDYCSFGIVKALGIESHIWMSSAMMLDYMAYLVGAPNPVSYIPNAMSGMSDRMTPFERLKNAAGFLLAYGFTEYMNVGPQTELFRKYYGPDFPRLSELARKSPLVFINSEELLDFPRPVLHKTIYMGGIGMRDKKALKKLQPEFEKFMGSATKGAVLISFGSVANSSSMPDHWKDAFLQTVGSHPDIKFIWKYEIDFPAAKKYSNLLVSPWVPQRELFAHPNLGCFVTHGGYNSLTEAAFSGVPMITIPLFGDQHANARRAERHKIAVQISKMEVSKASLTAAIDQIFNNPEYKTIPNLEPVGAELNMIEYYLIDVFAGLIFLLLIGVFLLVRIVKAYVWWCCGTHKQASKKTSKVE